MLLLSLLTSILLLCSSAVATEEKPYSPIRITFFLTKSANITEEEFHYHYSTHHGPLVTPWLKRYGIIEYNQFHSPSASRNAIKPLSGPTATIATYDASAEFLVESVEVFQKAFLDSFYAEQVHPDEIYLFGDSPFVLEAGYRQTFWKADVPYVGVENAVVTQ